MQLPGNIVTNAAIIVLDGEGSQLLNSSSTNALSGFTTNAAAGSFTIQNGRNFTVSSVFANAGAFTVGDLSTLSLTGGTLTNTGGTITAQSGGTLQLSGGTLLGGLLSGAGTLTTIG